MTRPIYEPSLQRTDRRLGFSADQLFRRPGVGPTSGLAIYEIKVFEDQTVVEVMDDAFVWEIPEDLDEAQIVKVEAFITTAGGDDLTVQIRHSDPCDVGSDILSTPITIDAGECNSKDAATQPVISGGAFDVAWGDHLHCDVTADGDGAKGLGLIVTLVQAPLGSVVLAGAEGPQGPPGGIVNWLGEWDDSTTYDPNDAVSHNGSSYVAINTNTNVEPGVDAGWETDWMLLAAAGESGGSEIDYVQRTSNLTVTATVEASSNNFVSSNSISYDGSTLVLIEFFAPTSDPTQFVVFTLWEDSTDLGWIADINGPAATPVYCARRLTPSAGSHTYHIKAFRGTGTATVYGGSGGAGNMLPAFIRITVV